ncbi:MAG: metal-dependent hydrolase [Cyanobacteria bacterium P01_E01_bin.34]
MNTPTHFLIGAATVKFSRYPLVTSAFLLGSIAPDIPLYLLSVSGYFHYTNRGMSAAEAFRHMFNDLFFNDPVWIALHNALHSPLVLAVTLALLWSSRDRIGSLARWSFYFFLACLLHTALDIPTHVHDGPLLFFPLNWSIRFLSPISYWDPNYFGREFTYFELALDILLLLVLAVIPGLKRIGTLVGMNIRRR